MAIIMFSDCTLFIWLNILWPQLPSQPYFRWNITFKPFEVSILIILQICLRVMVRASMYVKCIPLKYSIPSPLVFIILRVGGIIKFLSFYKIPAGKYIIGWTATFIIFFIVWKKTCKILLSLMMASPIWGFILIFFSSDLPHLKELYWLPF